MKKVINSPELAPPIGPYSPGLELDNWLFTAGQIALDSEGNMKDQDLETEAHQVMQNLKVLLENAGMGFEHVVKCSIFLADMNDFAQVNEIYGGYFAAPYPVRETVEVARLPKDARVEISLIAKR